MKKEIYGKQITRIMGQVDPRLQRMMWNYASYQDFKRFGYPEDSMMLKDMLKDIKETIKTIGN